MQLSEHDLARVLAKVRFLAEEAIEPFEVTVTATDGATVTLMLPSDPNAAELALRAAVEG